MNKKMLIGMCMILVTMFCLTGCGNDKETKESNVAGGANMEDNIMEEDVTESTMEDHVAPEDDEVAEGELQLKEVLEGDVAPEFTATLVDGSTFTLSEHRGKVVLLNFWATWCGPCVGEMPAFQDLYEECGDEVAILAVNCMEDEETVKQFAKDYGYTFPIAIDETGKVSFTYPSSGIPYTLVIGKDGIVKNIYVGAADADTQYQVYKSAIEAALTE